MVTIDATMSTVVALQDDAPDVVLLYIYDDDDDTCIAITRGDALSLGYSLVSAAVGGDDE